MDEFLEILSGQVRSGKARMMVRKEMEDHIKDQAEAYKASGMAGEEALKEAVRQMGDPVEAGVELDRIHRPKMEWRLFAWVILFSILGLVIQYICFYGPEGTGGRTGRIPTGSMDYFFRQCAYTAVGLAVMAAVCLWDYSVIGKYAGILGALFLGGLGLICESGILRQVNGGYGYLKCLTYLFVPLYAGILYKNRGKGYQGLGLGILWIGILFLVGGCIGGGLGMISDSILVCVLMLFMAVWKKSFGTGRKTGTAMLILVFGIFALVFVKNLAPYQIARIQVWFHPEDFRETSGYYIDTIRRIVASLSFNKSSLGILEQRGLLDFLENLEVYNEFMILQTAVTLGIFKTACICILFAVFLFCLFSMAVRQKNRLGRMMGLGCTMILTVETLGNILSNFGIGLVSTGGVPFFSYGKGHTLVVYVLLGILLSIYRHENLVWEEPEGERGEKGMIARIGSYVIRIEKHAHPVP